MWIYGQSSSTGCLLTSITFKHIVEPVISQLAEGQVEEFPCLIGKHAPHSIGCEAVLRITRATNPDDRTIDGLCAFMLHQTGVLAKDWPDHQEPWPLPKSEED